ncbi:MAG: protein kinase [Herpetosiphonaceae bacterium]|nr:protein kinase [Herpetosiphonaceae bacterium]
MSASASRAKAAPAPRRDDDHELRNYRLEERIGQEELATTYRARHLTLDRPVEVHVLRRSDWVSVSRFQQAARLGARLKHPNILPVIDAGHDDRFGYYLVTPPLGGRLLQEILEDGALPVADAVRIFSEVARALDTVHAEGIIHRDVQPGSIVVVEQIGAEEAAVVRHGFLTNFSLALSSDGPDLSQLEEADYLTAYAPPEQDFKANSSSPALDVYALGAVLYHMLTGEVPPPPGQTPRPLSDFNQAIAPAERVIRRLLSPQANLRYTVAGQAAAALRQALRDQLGGERTAALATTAAASTAEAEWLENPVEPMLVQQLANDFVQRGRSWARQLHEMTFLRTLLNGWSSQNVIRRRSLGNAIMPDQVVSYNFYTYELRAYYETRTTPEPREKPYQGSRLSDRHSPPGVWQIVLPDPQPFDELRPQEMVVPHSERVEMCIYCGGKGDINCAKCHGRGLIEERRLMENPDGTRERRVVTADCPQCSGEGQADCARCKGSGQLLTEDVFMWSRWGKLWDNTDDETGLPLPDIRARSEQVYSAQIDVRDQKWHAIAPLHELLQAAENVDADQQTRLLHAELTISGTPVTEVDYNERGATHTLYLVGFDPPTIRGDFSLYDRERITLYAVIALLVVLVIVAILIF